MVTIAREEEVYKKILCDCGINISSATVKRIYYKKPVSGDSGYWSALVEGTDYLYHYTAADEFDEEGDWRIEPYIEMGSYKGRSKKTAILRVVGDFGAVA